MDAVSVIAVAAAAWWALMLATRATVAIGAFVHPAVRRRKAARADEPAVSVIIPVVRMEPEVEAAFVSVFSQAYPKFEVLITAAEQDSAVIDCARQVAGRFPHVPVRFLLGNERFTLNPKVSNLAPAIAAAQRELILVKDANIALPAGRLAELVRNLTPGTGMVCAVPIGVRPQSFAAEIECTILNGHIAPAMLMGSLFRLNLGFGKVMLFDRGDFERVDGLSIMAPTFGDDHALAKALGRAGLRTVYSAGVVHQVMARRSLREVWDRQLRWMVIRRDEATRSFLGEPFLGVAFATLAGAAAAPIFGVAWWALAAVTLALCLAGETVVVVGRGWGWGWRRLWRLPLAVVCREFLLIGAWASAWFARRVKWAGVPFDLASGTSAGRRTSHASAPQ